MWGLEKLKGVGHLQLLALKARPRAWNKVKAKPTPDGRNFEYFLVPLILGRFSRQEV